MISILTCDMTNGIECDIVRVLKYHYYFSSIIDTSSSPVSTQNELLTGFGELYWNVASQVQ